jgi:glycosyltransferase involved in cell wall biosynthesis
MTRVAVVIPVGPDAAHCEYLGEAIESVRAQTVPPDFVILVDDMHGIVRGCTGLEARDYWADPFVLAAVPWRLGVAGAFNAGVAWAFEPNRDTGPFEDPADLALMMGADDRIEPDTVERLIAKYEAEGKRDGYYWLSVRYSDGRGQHLPCHAAAFTAGAFRELGGFSPLMGAGAPDAAAVSIMLVHRPKWLIAVQEHNVGEPLYWHRVHAGQATAENTAAVSSALITIRDHLTSSWKPAKWGHV